MKQAQTKQEKKIAALETLLHLQTRKDLVDAKVYLEKRKELHAELMIKTKTHQMMPLLKEIKALNNKTLEKHICQLEIAFADFNKTAKKDRAALNILSSECLTILKNAQKDMSKMNDPLTTRLYNAIVNVISAFLNLLDRFQAWALSRPMIDQANRERMFKPKATPVQDTKDALNKFETALTSMNKEINHVVEETPAPSKK